MTKYVAYCRKSTDEADKQVLSIEAQIAEVKEFAARENLKIAEVITESRTVYWTQQFRQWYEIQLQ
jgi:DNA invertase Pin-like site-specific DNA recombinase